MQEEYFSIDDAAREIGCSRATMCNLIKRNNLTTFKRPLDRKKYVRKADVQQLLSTFVPESPNTQKAA